MNPSPKISYDRIYKELFSNPVMVMQLLHGFCCDTVEQRNLIEQLDPASFLLLGNEWQHVEQYSGDLVIRLETYSGVPLYICLMLEIQTTIDQLMALRINRYIIELYEIISKTKEAVDSNTGRIVLPMTLNLVFYLGDAEWSAPLSVDEMIMGPKFHRAFPMRYQVIAVNQVSRSKLEQMGNELAAIIRFEQSVPDRLLELAKELGGLLQTGNRQAHKAMLHWLKFYTKKSGMDHIECTKILEEFADDSGEVKMFDQVLKEAFDNAKNEGIQQGKEIGVKLGEKRGVKRGEKRSLEKTALRMLELKADVEFIIKVTGLTREEIEKLR